MKIPYALIPIETSSTTYLRMNTLEIEQALKNNPITRKQFCGVFAADEIPTTFDTLPCGLVVNTDPISEPGTHWVAFYLPSQEHLEFFDSYGNHPEYYGFNLKPTIWNQRKLQSSWTDVCGQYCIFYLYQKTKGLTMHEIVNMFTHDTSLNDCTVACYVKKHFNIAKHPLCGLIQCCKPLM